MTHNCLVMLLDSLTVWTRLPHIATSTHDFVDEEELLAEDWSDVQELSLNNIVVPDVGFRSWKRLTSQCVHTEGFLVLNVRLLDLDEGFLGIETTVLGKSTRHDQKGISEALNTELSFSRNFLGALILDEMLTGSNFESASTGNNSLVFDSVLDGAKTIADGILSLSDRVIVRSLDQNGAREGVLDTLNESVLVITERLLVDKLGEAEIRLLNVIDGVELLATAGKRNTLTVPALGTADTYNVVAGQDLKRRRVNTLLVDNNEVFVSAVAEALLELNDLHDAVISELTLRLNELLPLLGVAPEESRVDLSLLVLE